VTGRKCAGDWPALFEEVIVARGMKAVAAPRRPANKLVVRIDPGRMARGHQAMPRAQVFARKGTGRLRTRAARSRAALAR
jgi:hypothetical protein